MPEMLALLSAVVQDSDIAAIADNPKIGKDRLTRLMLDICRDQINEEGGNFLKLLVQNGRLKLLPVIAELYEKSKAEDEGYVDVDVKTAFAFTKAEEKSFATSLAKTLNKTVNLNVEVDKSLIGGVLARAGDRVIDGSIRGQIQQLAKRL